MEQQKHNYKKIAGAVLFVTLLASCVHAALGAIRTPVGYIPKSTDIPGKSDYRLMLLQCLGGLIVMFLPNVIERLCHVDLPHYTCISYYVFLYCAIYLGEVHRFYFRVPHWDTILHTYSGGMLAIIGSCLFTLFLPDAMASSPHAPLFAALFAFSFALMAGCLWEVYEYTADGLFGLNMQHYQTAAAAQLTGRGALYDTMKDIIVDALGAAAGAGYGYLLQKRRARAAVEAA